jgi:hypothetical protein
LFHVNPLPSIHYKHSNEIKLLLILIERNIYVIFSRDSANDDDIQLSQLKEKGKTKVTTKNKVSTYVIPPSLRKPFKIPCPKQALATGLPSKAFSTPKTGQTIIKYGRVLHMTMMTLVNMTTDKESHPAQPKSIASLTSPVKPNMVATELTVAQAQTSTAKQLIHDSAQGYTHKEVMDDIPILERLNPNIQGNGKTLLHNNCQVTPDLYRTHT